MPSKEDLVSAVTILFEYILTFMLKKGKVENVIMIMDHSGVNPLTAPMWLVKHVLSTIQGQYKGMSRSIFTLNSPYAFSLIWKTVRYFIDATTASKIQINSSPTFKGINDLVPP